ncbi:MAG TPA: DegT/DnrJ/EryC1/StrS family aminotransferase [Candidatus Hydrogenedentes bacterium]|nr:DegT/DnrJ/EryC1/StrS family aminotransferase [Candidatus Hydrogenedentota bacterium]HPG68394.1 DegT/DnrJ/EryC1/StrS family aminotransferase [Candidatus Hydrogenedentota bacterium]
MSSLERAKFGAQAHLDEVGALPTAFPRTLGPNAARYVQEVLDSGLTCDMMGRFERAFAEALGVKHCIATPGCTPALAVLAATSRLEPGDEVIVSPVTDYGTIQGLLTERLIPVFADTGPDSINLNADTIRPCITDRTRAILVVHMTGLICDMDALNDVARAHGLAVYEDACQAVFGEYRGRFAGTLAKAAGFSFDSEKTMGSDVGGCLVTNDDDLAEYARFIGQSRGAVMKPHFGRLHTAPGYAYRMPLCTAAICLAQLEVIREHVRHRDTMIRLLTRYLGEIPGITPLPIPDYVNVYSCWMAGFSLAADAFRCDAETFARQLTERGIPGAGTGEYYLMPAAVTCLQEAAAAGRYPYSMPPASRKYRYDGETCPTAQRFLKTFIRWSTFCEKYRPEHCARAAEIVAAVAAENRA